jgi:hypothetical protein
MTRREWLATIAAAPLLNAANPEAPAAPVSIAKCATYDEDVQAKLATLFDQLGGLERLVRNKTVTVKINMTGAPSQRVQGLAPALTHYTHPKLIGATAYLIGKAGARRIRFVESAWATSGPLEDVMLDSGWNVRTLLSAAGGVEFENTNALGKGKSYARFKVPENPYMYPAYDLNHSYEDTDVFVSMAKLKNHDTCGITLSLKNCFGIIPASIYGDSAGVDEPNENPPNGRLAVGHQGKRQPSKSAPQELHFGANHDAGYRVPCSRWRPSHVGIRWYSHNSAGLEGSVILGDQFDREEIFSEFSATFSGGDRLMHFRTLILLLSVPAGLYAQAALELGKPIKTHPGHPDARAHGVVHGDALVRRLYERGRGQALVSNRDSVASGGAERRGVESGTRAKTRPLALDR